MVLYVMLVEFYTVCNFVNANAFVSCVHCGKLLVAHLDGAEAQAVVCNSLVMTAVGTACHKIGDNTCFGIDLYHSSENPENTLVLFVELNEKSIRIKIGA